MKLDRNANIKRELRYGHMQNSGFAKWVKDGYEDWDGDWVDQSKWEYDHDGYDSYLKTLELTESEIKHLTGEYNREVDLGAHEAFEKMVGKKFWADGSPV